jgi:hypothetical protein
MLSSRKTLFKTLIVLLSLGLAPALASADIQEYEYEVKKKGTDRDGFVFGIGVGVGHMQCDAIGCEDLTQAAGLNFQLGAMIGPRFAIMGDLWAMAHRENRLTLTQAIASVGPQVWLADRVWLRAGLGVARSGFNYDAEIVDISDRTDLVPAATGALGFELITTDVFALDLQLRAGAGFFHEDSDDRVQNYSLGVGASFF